MYTNKGPLDNMTLMDRAVSSYTPTLETLLRPRTSFKKPANNDVQARATEPRQPRILIVSKSTDAEGKNAIPNTGEEVNIVRDIFNDSESAKVSILSEDQATVKDVLDNMATHCWIHLACHGIQDAKDPMRSGFILNDDRLTLSMLMNKALPNADLAVLSACQTATGERKLSEEAVHLAAAMLNAGFKSVIGTMWSISDSIAPQVARTFYKVLHKQLQDNEELQPGYAFHNVVLELRRTEDFIRWVPFVPFGL